MKKLFLLFVFCFSLFITNFSLCQWVSCLEVNGFGTYGYDTIGTSIYCSVYGLGGIYRSTDNGINWTSISSANQFVSFGVTHNSNYIFTAAHVAKVYRTSNNGLNWIQINSGLPADLNASARAIIAKDNFIFVGLCDSGVYRSTNNGDNWVRTDTTLHSYYVYTFAFCGPYLFAGTNDGVYRTSNNGINWQIVTSGVTNYGGWSLSVNGTNIYTAGSVGGGTGGAYFSTNYGNNWNLVYSGVGVVFSINNLIFVSNGNNFLVTKNNGINWINRYEGISGNSSDIVTIFAFNNFAYAGGFNGVPYTSAKLLWRRPISELVQIKNISNNIPDEYKLYQNYPNPFNPSTNIKYQITNNSPRQVTLKVYDIIGKEVATLVNEKQLPGVYEVTWDTTQYPSGAYFYKLTSGVFTETKKALLIK